ncbi:MAG: DUF308 domain-containing protein [Lachnospiraceae bacterium]|nr:DUF308 domain-containing protein [Lachnospiraceae bacterium]
MKKTFKPGMLLLPILYLVLGVACIVAKDELLRFLGLIVGIGFIVVGAILIIAFIARDARKNILRNDMLIGFGLIALGIVMLIHSEEIITMIPFILGIMIVISGAAKLQQMVNMAKLGLPGWLPTFIAAVLNIVLGVLMIINPASWADVIMMIIGIGLVFSAVTDLIFTLYYNRSINNRADDETVETTFTEVESSDEKA